MPLTSIKAIVLSIKITNDNNHIVSFFTNYGVLKLVASGITKPLSKNRANLLLGSIVELEYFPARLKNKTGRLKKAVLLEALDIKPIQNIYFFNAIKKIFLNIFEINHLFDLYLKIFKYLNKKNNYKILTFFYAQSLFYFGIKPNFEACAICDSQRNLVSFDFYEGGFMCALHGQGQHMSVEYLNAIWASYHDLKKYLMIVDDNLDYNLRALYKSLIIEAGYYI
ncbi:DNA repair protein RecO [Mycoplasmopsis bovirhinis]|uniref:DNA repair protein RecO n=1 Tax=Mycoplasmopsis bovirhinis TaxID=29553 RepID=UPI000C05C250|nr:DNA repair protein RecO [Mycoplasmopsis bovirhinis]ATO30683.1 DNA repair protein RecO [Mycoplasmopsis bovirhinis]